MGLSPSAGDVVTISVTATTATSATVVITNESTNQTVSQVVTTGNLCMEEADWLVEDFEVDGSLITLADFDEIKFTDVSAGTARGSLDISGATILNIEQNGTVLTAVSSSRSTVDIVYV
ncbi:uncharacterized protein PHACADRAFT_266226 [Phanerochaete carnosa HHB-10118-sp]|uniref:Uncharacterized protein n=1 Tax=Phanerochaete carnosa (strain HHB-10118-sp) TaxID=650164 RepID=K5UGP5_PHACS|nr:uncharacterized protein PHACADRAFT_266226 [Phanerochaete carnosa HHB-10118-sp]EKM48651.1 hypothetical protein PHACADRAFT_266226 [Phanerochaete carnosa HHB-10118-sp]